MDATANDRVPSQMGVEGFPMLKFFRNGKMSEYTGGRTEKEIIDWVRKKSGPAAKTVSTADEAAAFEKSAEVAVLGVFSDVESAEAKVRRVGGCGGSQRVPPSRL